jgi:hypothetical protein
MAGRIILFAISIIRKGCRPLLSARIAGPVLLLVKIEASRIIFGDRKD